jgi:Copper transport outer membrane protein, MctB
MGFSARYHAASLAAVFLALAVGILIGAGLGSDVVSGTAEDLEESLKSDLTEAEDENAALRADLDRERELSGLLFPVVAADRLPGREVAIVALGALPDDLSASVEEALEPTGAEVSSVAVVGEPPDTQALIDALAGPRASELPRGAALNRAALAAGEAMVRGGADFTDVREALLDRFSGTPGDVDAVVLIREQPQDLGTRVLADTERLDAGLIEGMRDTGAVVVGVERSDDDNSSIDFFDEQDISSVDSVDLRSGQVALVFALAGAEGRFGVKASADRLLPDLLAPAVGSGQ